MNGTKDNRLSRIYREGAWPEPSRQIDAAILSASRRAVREQHSFAKRWAPAFAIAATVMLTSALVLKVYWAQPEIVTQPASDQEPESRATGALPAAEPKAAETSAAPAPAPQAVVTPKGFSSTMDAAEAERLDRLQRDLGAKQGLPPSGSPLSAQKPAPAERAAPALNAPALKKEASQLLQRRPDLPQSQSARPREATSPPHEQRPMSVFGASSPAPAPAPAPASPPAPTPASTPAPASAPAAAAAASGAVTSALSTAPKAPERSPQAWIDEIRKLMAAGQSEEAGAEIAKFKKRYPDYTLPEDLR